MERASRRGRKPNPTIKFMIQDPLSARDEAAGIA